MGEAPIWEAIATWFAEEAELEFVRNEIANLAIEEATMGTWKELVAYQGFDVKKVMIAMKRASEAYTQNSTGRVEYAATLTPGGGNVDFRWSNQEPKLKDMMLLIYLFANRGSSWAKIKEKSISVMGDIMDMLEVKYNIDVTKRTGETSLKPDTVTLPRIAACLPMLVCTFYHLGHGKPLCSLEELGLTGEISKSILCNSFPCVIPQGLTGNNKRIHFLSFYVHLKVDKVIHKKDQKYTDVHQILTYYTASHNTPAVPTATQVRGRPSTPRLDYLKLRGLFTAGGAPLNVLISDEVFNAIKEKMKEVRPAVSVADWVTVFNGLLEI